MKIIEVVGPENSLRKTKSSIKRKFRCVTGSKKR